ncbi:HSP20-like chaperone [Desarmillaria tabescens]|uniref:HSP20-like chaperone n=1 Tax=Armillaria tabescens TaxID=1929756 RepID=A0AA39NR50_ARMTA|nr:HSP20-like chaperone [Desarmillaria tabescens]KAK0470271.1 HSP20-like chaperone [Desarmillaria tabescens]
MLASAYLLLIQTTMSVYYYEPFYNFDRLFDAFTRPASQQLQAAQDNTATATLKPRYGFVIHSVDSLSHLLYRMDLHEDSAKNIVTATFELPGLKKEDVQIDVHDGRLTISGESKISLEHEENGYAVRERKFGKFSRTLRLPQGVKEEIKASLDNGVLTVTFPKASPETAPKKITIS